MHWSHCEFLLVTKFDFNILIKPSEGVNKKFLKIILFMFMFKHKKTGDKCGFKKQKTIVHFKAPKSNILSPKKYF